MGFALKNKCELAVDCGWIKLNKLLDVQQCPDVFLPEVRSYDILTVVIMKSGQ